METIRKPIVVLATGFLLMIIGSFWERSLINKAGPEWQKIKKLFPGASNRGRMVMHVGFALVIVEIVTAVRDCWQPLQR